MKVYGHAGEQMEKDLLFSSFKVFVKNTEILNSNFECL